MENTVDASKRPRWYSARVNQRGDHVFLCHVENLHDITSAQLHIIAVQETKHLQQTLIITVRQLNCACSLRHFTTEHGTKHRSADGKKNLVGWNVLLTLPDKFGSLVGRSASYHQMQPFWLPSSFKFKCNTTHELPFLSSNKFDNVSESAQDCTKHRVPIHF